VGKAGGDILLELRVSGYGKVLLVARVIILDDFLKAVFLELYPAVIVDIGIKERGYFQVGFLALDEAIVVDRFRYARGGKECVELSVLA
jgi:hypothetical protein